MTFPRDPKVGGVRRQMLSAFAYGLVVLGLLAVAFSTVSALIGDQASVAALRQRLADLDTHTRSSAAAATLREDGASGSPFLSAPTVTLAGAALQQRIESAIAKAGGALLSEQVELDGAAAKDGFLSLTANLEIDQPALQPLLYDLEAGIPYLFVDSLDVQAPQAFGETENGRMKVTISISGKWELAR